MAHLKIEMFTKYFFPNKLKELGGEKFDFSDSDESRSPMDINRQGASNSLTLDNNNTMDTTSVVSTTKNKDLTIKIK